MSALSIVVGLSLLLQCSCENQSTKEEHSKRSIDAQRSLHTQPCPTWMYRRSPGKRCVCSWTLRDSLVLCSHSGNLKVGVLHGYCMTHAENDNESLIIGACQYNTMAYNKFDAFYYNLPLDPNKVDSAMCGDFHRLGQMCGRCEETYSPPVYSYHPQCVHCTAANNWGKYLAVSLLPPTAFLLVVLTLRISATAPHMSGFILYSQLITSPPILREEASVFYKFRNDTLLGDISMIDIAKAVFTFHGIWNLDFLRLVYSPFCLQPDTTMLQVLSLDYIIAVYPLILVILVLMVVKLHSRDCKLVVWLWRPFHRCFYRCRRQWNIQTSLVDAFVTFFLLSYIKCFSVSFDLLFPAIAFTANGHPVSPTYLFYDGTVEYFGPKHLPYALIAIGVLLVFTILPIVILCLYPYRCVQRCLNHYHLSYQALHILMDTFQGGYKNGTNGTPDRRYFAGVYLIIRVAVYMSLISSIWFYNYWYTLLVLMLFLGFLSMTRPFKVEMYNKLDIVWMLLLLVFFSVIMPFSIVHTQIEVYAFPPFFLIFLGIPLLCCIYVGVHCLVFLLKCTHTFCTFQCCIDTCSLD